MRSRVKPNEISSTQPTSSSVFWKWVLNCTLGELIGFGGLPVFGAVLVLAVTASAEPGPRSLLLYGTAIVGGLGEGAVLAWFQLRVLRHLYPNLNRTRWVLATALAASFAWMAGYLAPTLDDLFDISTATQIAIWIPAGVLILLSIGTAQAWVLRDVVERPSYWFLANIVGWLLGLIWTFLLPALVPESAPMPVWVSVFVVAGVLMGTTVGVVTAFVLVRLSPKTVVS